MNDDCHSRTVAMTTTYTIIIYSICAHTTHADNVLRNTVRVHTYDNNGRKTMYSLISWSKHFVFEIVNFGEQIRYANPAEFLNKHAIFSTSSTCTKFQWSLPELQACQSAWPSSPRRAGFVPNDPPFAPAPAPTHA